MCLEDPALAHSLLDKYTDSLCIYASYQIESGAQVMQIFESWAHHLSEEQWVKFAKVGRYVCVRTYRVCTCVCTVSFVYVCVYTCLIF